MNKRYLSGIGAVALIIMFLIVKVLKEDSEKHYGDDPKSQYSEQEILQKVSDEVNKRCPMTINEFTRMDNSVVLSNKTIRYDYTLLQVDTKSNEYDLDSYFKEQVPVIINSVKTDPGMKLLRDMDATFSYNYSDVNGIFLYECKIEPKDYN